MDIKFQNMWREKMFLLIPTICVDLDEKCISLGFLNFCLKIEF